MLVGTLELQMAMNLARLADDMKKAASTVSGAMGQINSVVSTTKGILGSLGIGFGVGYFVSLVKSANDAVANMKDLGLEAGTTAAAISRFEAPARSAGLGLENVAAAMFKMNQAALESKDPGSKAAQALNAIGISTTQLKNLKPDEMFELVARSISKYGDGLAKNSVMQELFGKSGREMNRVVAEIAESGKLAATVTDEEAAQAKLLNDRTLELRMNSEKLWRGLVADGVPAVNDIVKAFIAGNKELGIFGGLIAGVTEAFDQLFSQSLEQKLGSVNEQIAGLKQSLEPSFLNSLFGNDLWKPEIAAQMNELLERRVLLEKAIIQQRQEAANRAAAAAAAAKTKPEIIFDPTASREAEALGKALQEGMDEEVKIMSEVADLMNKFRTNELAREQAYRDNRNQILMDSYDREQEEAIRQGEETIAIEEAITEQKKREQAAQLAGAQSFLGNLASLMNTHSKRAFEAGKIAALAQAAVSGALAVMDAWRSGMSTGGWWAPVVAAAYAAAAAANALNLMNNIRKQSFGGGGSVPIAPTQGSSGISPAGLGGGSVQPPSAAPVEIHVQIINQGTVVGSSGMDELVNDYVVPTLKDAIDNRSVVIIGPNSRQAQDLVAAAS